MDLFGSGFLYATQTQDAFGNPVTSGTPTIFGIMQEMSVDISKDVKELYGQQQFPVDVAAGKMKIAGKVKFAGIFASLFDAVFYGQGVTKNGLLAVNSDTAGSLIPASSPYTITPTAPNSGTIIGDLGVISATGQPYTKVASAPATGQYSYAAGVWTFAPADTGKRVYVNYQYTVSAANAPNASTQTLQNLPMGATPYFGINFSVKFNGKTKTFVFPRCTSSKLSMGFKNEDFTIPELDYMALMDPVTGTPMQWSTSE